MRDNSNKKRRDVMKSLGGAFVTATTFSSVGAARRRARNHSEINTKFDPDDSKAVYRFAQQLEELPEEEGRQIVRNLSKRRKEAYIEAMKPTEFDTDVNEIQRDGIQAADAGSRAYAVSTTAKSPSGLVAYEYEVTVNFGWDSDHEEITTLNADAGPVQTGLPWRYRGEATDIVSNNGESGYVKQTGDFGMCVFVPACVIVDERNPSISLRVEPRGDVNVLTKDNDN